MTHGQRCAQLGRRARIVDIPDDIDSDGQIPPSSFPMLQLPFAYIIKDEQVVPRLPPLLEIIVHHFPLPKAGQKPPKPLSNPSQSDSIPRPSSASTDPPTPLYKPN